LKVNSSGVIPIIFASSVLYLPIILSQVLPVEEPVPPDQPGNWAYSVQRWIQDNLVTGDSIIYMVLYGSMIIFFAYFYTAIAFNPMQQADIIRKQGGFIPGIRPGPPTERYLGTILNRITLPGSLFLAAIALVPQIALAIYGVTGFPFGGTTILIAVGVALETMKQIDSQLMMRNYEGFLT
ncbi:MAG: preprotein translocase subunit SecY, partial [Acidimicrobiales bacterium]